MTGGNDGALEVVEEVVLGGVDQEGREAGSTRRTLSSTVAVVDDALAVVTRHSGIRVLQQHGNQWERCISNNLIIMGILLGARDYWVKNLYPPYHDHFRYVPHLSSSLRPNRRVEMNKAVHGISLLKSKYPRNFRPVRIGKLINDTRGPS
ncbi:uncharacterized protein EI90DRAFT_3013719 [Cantharellus anzutake]|uniref:uncharacterized protein n=1 Tax=Cantharellus anzutake TaxID=1750568 RepID=UPI0019058F0E|nr:uncharacterized protein EI90DRAFT_3013719 [Cantharellus anzutake]KAF8337521.1 hypothetical protein EI90DRAFT_3013719 [Cantharellus anzutake]